MDETLATRGKSGRIKVIVTKGFAIPCVFYVMVGLALYPQLGTLAPMVGVTMVGQPSVIEWLFAGFYFMLIGIGGVVAHEVGHALVIKYRHRGNALIALSSQVGTRHAPIEGSSRLMAFSGPAFQATYGALVLIICYATDAFYFGVLAVYILVDSIYNLLPFRNFDGYYIFRNKKSRLATIGQDGSS